MEMNCMILKGQVFALIEGLLIFDLSSKSNAPLQCFRKLVSQSELLCFLCLYCMNIFTLCLQRIDI